MQNPTGCLVEISLFSFSFTGLIAFSVLPQLAQKVKLFISFAPPYTLEGVKGPQETILSIPVNLGKVSMVFHRECYCTNLSMLFFSYTSSGQLELTSS